MEDNISEFLKDLLSGFFDLLPILITVIFILLIGYLLGRLIQHLVRRFILYLNEKMNQQLQNSMLNVDLKNSAQIIARTLFWIIIIISILISIQILHLDFLTLWFDRIVGYLPNILVAVIIVFVGIVSGRLLSDLIKSAASRTGIVNGIWLGSVVKYLTLFVSIVIAVDQLGVDIAFLTNLVIIILASLLFGASLAFGLGAKTAVSNILGSYYVRKSHQLGTRIRLGEVEGTIVKITDYSVSIETKTGLILVPAKEFNESHVTIIREDHE